MMLFGVWELADTNRMREGGLLGVWDVMGCDKDFILVVYENEP